MSGYNGDPGDYRVYWFARDLVASSYGNFASKEKAVLRQLASELEADIARGRSTERLWQLVESSILGGINREYGDDISKRYRQTEDLVERMERRIDTRGDFRELQIAIEAVVRTGEILDTTPSFGKAEIVEIVDETLVTPDGPDPSRVYDALYNVDIDGEAYQLGAQREPLIEYVHDKMSELDSKPETDRREVARIISGIVQEYERRAGQSRAATAGNVLETGLQHIFDRFGIPATGTPDHFGDLELDNIVEGPRGSVGFSCKRTLRERFRQSLSREAEIGVDEVWFVSLLMADVSREKLEDIANDGSRIYVPRDSFVWERFNQEGGLSNALRPANEFIPDLVEFTGVPASL